MPTRMAKAVAIFWPLDLALLLLFIIKNRAVPKLPTMAKNANRTKYFMLWIMS